MNASGFRRDAVIALALLVLGAAPRLWNLSGSSLNGDELLWMQRGERLTQSLRQGRWIEATAELKHPGVIVALLVGLSQDLLGRADEGTPGRLDAVATARLPLALMGALAAPCLFLMGRRLWSRREAGFAALFLALAPVHIGLSRLAHLDAALTFFLMLTLLAYGVAETGGGWRWKLASGLFFGCALLTKSPAYLAPLLLIGWRVAVWAREGGRVRPLVAAGDAAAILAGFVVYLVLFTRLSLPPATQYWFEDAGQWLPYGLVHAACRSRWLVPVLAVLAAAYAVMRRRDARRAGRDLPPTRAPVARGSTESRPPWQVIRPCVTIGRWRATLRGAGGLRCLVPRTRVEQWMAFGLFVLVVLLALPNPLENSSLVLRRMVAMGTSGGSSGAGTAMGSVEAPRSFYAFMLLVRLPELLVAAVPLGAAACAWRAARDRRAAPAAFLAVAGVGFVLGMMWGRRVAMRYILPAVPFLCVLGGIGVSATLDAAERWARRRGEVLPRWFAAAAGAALIAGGHAPGIALYAPDYYLYYNTLIGGASGAVGRVLVGWGEGYRETVVALKELAAGRDEVNVTVLGMVAPMQYYWPHGSPRTDTVAHIGTRPFEEADYVVLVLTTLERNRRSRLAEYGRDHRPLRVIGLHGVDLVWIYAHEREAIRKKTTFAAANKILDFDVSHRVQDPVYVATTALAALAARDEPGWLVRGPGRTFAAGDYEARFRLRTVEGAPGGEIGALSVTAGDGAVAVARRSLTAADLPAHAEYGDVVLPFRLDRPRALEFRVFFAGAADLYFSRVEIVPAARDGDLRAP